MPPEPLASATSAPPRLNRAAKAGGSAIFPWIVGAEHEAVDFSAWLAKKGLFAPAIRYPTVAKGSARLRLTVTARHQPAQIMALGKALAELVRNGPLILRRRKTEVQESGFQEGKGIEVRGSRRDAGGTFLLAGVPPFAAGIFLETRFLNLEPSSARLDWFLLS